MLLYLRFEMKDIVINYVWEAELISLLHIYSKHHYDQTLYVLSTHRMGSSNMLINGPKGATATKRRSLNWYVEDYEV